MLTQEIVIYVFSLSGGSSLKGTSVLLSELVKVAKNWCMLNIKTRDPKTKQNGGELSNSTLYGCVVDYL